MLSTSNYFISRNPNMAVVLAWIKQQGDYEIMMQDISGSDQT